MRSTTRSALVGLFTAAALAAASASGAKDLCVTDSFDGAIKFTKVSSLKKPGKIVPLHGLLVTFPMKVALRSWAPAGPRGVTPFTAPVVGTAATREDGSVVVGIFVLGNGGPIGSTTGSASLVTDENLQGTGVADFDGEFLQDFAYGWTAADCDTLPFP